MLQVSTRLTMHHYVSRNTETSDEQDNWVIKLNILALAHNQLAVSADG